jgi:hypothetical protein
VRIARGAHPDLFARSFIDGSEPPGRTDSFTSGVELEELRDRAPRLIVAAGLGVCLTSGLLARRW